MVVSRVDSLLTIEARHWQKLATTFELANSLPFAVAVSCGVSTLVRVVVVIEMGAYIHGVLILCGCLLSQFYGMLSTFSAKYVGHASIVDQTDN